MEDQTQAPVLSESSIRAYKGFDNSWRCRGYQYAVGRTYHHKGAVVACSSGFHACRNPLDNDLEYEPLLAAFLGP
jgi:hypothetical protein